MCSLCERDAYHPFLTLFSALEVLLYIYRAEEKAFCIRFSSAHYNSAQRNGMKRRKGIRQSKSVGYLLYFCIYLVESQTEIVGDSYF